MVNVMIVGAGGISERHIEGLLSCKKAKIVGIVDIDAERTRKRAATCGCKVFSSVGEGLSEVDAVYVLTPPSTHRSIAVQAMEAGKDVFIEKPITASIEDAERICATAKRFDVKCMVGFNMRFRVGYGKLHDFVQSGKVGKLTTYWCQRHGLRVDPKNKWSTDPLLMTGMTIQSLSHDIDAMHWIAGGVDKVAAFVQESRPELPGFDDNCNAVFRLDNGATANFQSSWSSCTGFNSRGVLGTEGTAYISGPDLWNMDAFHWKTKDMPYECIERIDDIHDARSFIAEDDYFINCIENNTMPSVTCEDGLRALRVSYAMLESSRNDKVISLNDREEGHCV